MRNIIKLFLLSALCMAGGAQAAKLTMDDKVARWPRATTDEKIEFATRMGKAFSSLAPGLDRNYFIKCLEETANIGNPGDIKLEEAVKMCVAVNKPPSEE
ncbi:hypothetical protein [Methylobacterium sp. J-090]|uniref:hypothetical protein n=1 Tax=Methylobacterium sp. J-090 TaxID=2836666 RepID=UPI001FB8FD54|nr:hypothetical protein [Methylobacterium sp. J-090]MCJ2079927.1 hypothetical protein [Methylobacterium sp. J-090]